MIIVFLLINSLLEESHVVLAFRVTDMLMSDPSDQHHSDRGPAADRAQHGPCGVCGDWRRQEVHVYEGVHQLPVLQRGETF